MPGLLALLSLLMLVIDSISLSEIPRYLYAKPALSPTRLTPSTTSTLPGTC